MTVEVESDRFQPIVLEPGASAAYSCFGTWENLPSCQPFGSSDEPLHACSQAAECRYYTLERNPPTTRFRAKPRRDGRFEVQQFREFIGDEETYHLEVEEGSIVVTCPGGRKVPKSKRFFLHVKHVEQAGLELEADLELVVSLDSMMVRQAMEADNEEGEDATARRRPTVTPDERRRRIADRLRAKAKVDASALEDDDDLDIEIEGDVDFELDDDIFDNEGLEAAVSSAPAASVVEEGTAAELEAESEEEEIDDLDDLVEIDAKGIDFAADDDEQPDEFETADAEAEEEGAEDPEATDAAPAEEVSPKKAAPKKAAAKKSDAKKAAPKKAAAKKTEAKKAAPKKAAAKKTEAKKTEAKKAAPKKAAPKKAAAKKTEAKKAAPKKAAAKKAAPKKAAAKKAAPKKK